MTDKFHVDWYLKPKRCRPSYPVSYKVLWEHNFQCFLPIHVTSRDRHLREGLRLRAYPWRAACQQGALHHGLTELSAAAAGERQVWWGAATSLWHPLSVWLQGHELRRTRPGYFWNLTCFHEFPSKPFLGSSGNTRMCCMRDQYRHWAQCTWRASNTTLKKKVKAVPLPQRSPHPHPWRASSPSGQQ